MKTSRILVSTTLIAFVSGVSANAVTIDTFETSQLLVARSNNSPVSGSVSGPTTDIIGGERDAEVTWVSGESNVKLQASAGGNGLLNFSVDADTSGDAVIVWDGSVQPPDRALGLPINPTGLGGVDLTEGGTLDRIIIRVDFLDLPINLGLQVFTGEGLSSSATLAITSSVTNPTDFELLFIGDFVADTRSAGADFSNVGAIVLTIDDIWPATDLQLDFIESNVPEPATLGLMALCSLALLRRRRS